MCGAVYIVGDLFLLSETIPIFRQTILYSTMDTLTINLNVKVIQKKEEEKTARPNNSSWGAMFVCKMSI